MSSRYIPDAEVFARHAACGLTRYTYEQVVAADAECSAAEADLDAAVAEAAAGPLAAFLREHWTEQVYIDSNHPELVQLWTLLNSEHMPSPACTGGRSNEMFAVKSWLAIAAKTRRYAARIRREIAALAKRAA